MTIAAAAGKNAAAAGYAAKALYCALSTTAPGSTAGTEVTGTGYARQAITWGAPASGVINGTVPAITVPSGQTVVGVEYFDALTGGNYIDGFSITSQAFPTGGTLTPTLTETIS